MFMSWTYAGLKRNAPGVILIVSLFAVMAPAALSGWANDASPIHSVDAVAATIKSAQWGHGRINYVLLLDDGSSLLLDDDRLRVIGSAVRLERVTRDNGFVFYRFAV
ncbi:MAG: hypothetical protein EOS56_09330 [Mesorhizobium sp.]|nr:MAG: hypothetical protein EOS29_17950 [Mesorhizobium sp.]RWC62201.1 MAG: hypothetical protein EOS56_09330 [Mesorhizobium sp.]